MSKEKGVASKGNSTSKQVKHKSAKNKGVSSLKNVSSQSANNASGHRLGVAAVALASTLSMVLPGATALAKTSFNADSFDSSYVNSVAKTSGKGAGNGAGKGSGNGKGDGDGNDLYKNGLFNTGATSELAKRQMVSSVKELVKHADSNVRQEGVDNQEAAAGDSSVSVKDSGERSDAGSEAGDGASYEASNGDNNSGINGTVDESNNNSNDVSAESSNKRIKTTTEVQAATKGAQNNQKVAKPDSKAAKKEQSAEAKPAETPAVKTEPAKSNSAKTDPAKTEVVNPATESKSEPANSEPATKADSETKTNSSAKNEPDQKSAQPANALNAQPENAQNAQPAAEQPESAQKASAEGTNPTSTESAQPAAKAKNDSTTTKVRNRRSVENNGGDNSGSSVAPASNAPAPSGTTANNAPTSPAATPSTDTTAQGNTQGQGSQGSAQGSAQGSQTNAQGSQSSAEGATTGATGEDKNATPSAPSSTSSPTSTPTTGTPTTGTTNTATDPNSQVIKPNTDNTTADSTDKANEQVQTDKKPKATYNLKVRYTIGGAANKQLVQPYELTIDKDGFDNLGKDGKYEYIELPKSAGYRPSVYHSGDYQYYVKKGEGDNSKFVIDDGTDADAVRYLRIDKKLITDYAVKERPAVGGNNGAQAPQTSSSQATTNPQPSSSTDPKAEDGIQYYGELNINYAPKTAKYYVRHLVQDLKDKDKFYDAPNLGIGKVITVKHKDGTSENIHVTEITGTVGSDVTAVSTYIPGYEPEHNLISSPLSDSEDESDKLVLNLRYYRKAYEVTYDSAGGTDVTAQKVYYQQPVPKVTEPTRRGYTFKGWSLVDPSKKIDPLYADDTTIASLDDFKMPDHNVQFRANWDAKKTTSYRVNVWVQKADLVDKEHPDSLANYDFVGLVERKNVQTDSKVALDKMNDAGVVDDTSRLNGSSEDDYVADPELGLTRKELQGTEANKYKDGLIAKFNWMNDTDTAVTDLDGYDTEHPGAATNKGKDLFTRYFHVNKDLTKKLNSEEHDFVPGRPDLGKRIKSKLCADDLNNTLNLVYDRNTYELIFAKPAVLKSSEDAERLNNAAIKRKDKDGKTTIYCYAGGGNCSEKYDEVNEDEDNNTINHKGYRVNVRYGQSLTDIWPNVNELDFNDDTGSLGWRIGYAGGIEFRDTPPFRFTKKEFADPKFRVVGNNHKLKISDNPDSDPNNTYELKDNQRLITADTSNTQVMPIQVIIEKQSIASAKKHKKGDTISDDDYVLSTDSYSKDDTSNKEYPHKSSFIAGFNSVDKELHIDKYDSDDFDNTLLSDLYSHSIEYKKNGEKDWDDLDDDVKEAFKKEYNVGFRNHLAGGDEDSTEYTENGYLVFKYKRQSYDVQFYNADGNAISAGTGSSDVAKEKLPFEYSLSKRGNAKLTGKDADLYYDNGNVKSYDASVTKDDANDTSKQLDGKYTFTLNGKTYSIIRPDYLPKDYVFKGWAVDQAGTRFINGEDKDITVPVNGIKLYAAWGKPEGIKHTVTLNYNMPEIDGNGKEIKDSSVVTKQQFDHYYVIKENKDIKVPTRKGYDFYGWEIKKNGTTLPYAFGNKVVEDITLNAVWVKDTRYNGTFKHIFLKPGYTFADYKREGLSDAQKAAMVDHISTQTVSGLREHLRYNAEAVYSDETHFPDKHFTSFEASSTESENTGEFIYQTYNTRKYKVKYIDQNGKDLLPESEVSSVNRKYDVAFYKPIEGFMPETTQQNIEYVIGEDGKQIGEKTITFKYKDVRVLKRNDDKQARPTNYTRYVFKVAKDQSSMGSVVDWQGSNVAENSALVYDAIKGTKAYQMPLPTVKAKPGYEFDVWTSKIYIDDGHGGQTHTDGFDRLPILSESQPNPKVIYTVKFKLKAPVAIDTKVLKPTDALSLDDNSAKELIKNADKYPSNAKFSFAPGEKFDSTPGLHKIKVQVHLDGNTAAAEVLYRVLPDLVYASDWEKFSKSDYGSKHKDDYVPIKFTGKNKEGKLIGHDSDNADTSTGEETTLTAYVYKGKDVRIRVPQAFGKDYSYNNYHYVFKGWATKVVEPTPSTPSSGTTKPDATKPEEKKPEQTFDINSSDRYKNVNLQDGVTYHAIYKRIDYFSSSSDNGTVPEDSVIAIFKPAPKRKWKDGSDGPKVFYVKKGANLADTTVKVKVKVEGSDNKFIEKEEKVLDFLKSKLINPTDSWSRSSMINGKEEVTPIPNVSDWKVDKPFQEFVADQKDWTQPEVQSDYLVAVQGKKLPKLDEYLTNLDDLKKEAETKGDVKDVTIEYDLPDGKDPKEFEDEMLKKPSLYTVPLRITVNYKDGAKPEPYKRVARLKVIYQLMYPSSLPKEDSKHPEAQTGANAERNKVLNSKDYVRVSFENAKKDNKSPNGKGEFAQGSRDLYYAYKESVSGVRAPQVIGKDYDADGYHYEFQGWEMRTTDTTSAANSTNTSNIANGTNTATSVAPVMTLFAATAPTPTTVPKSTTPRLYSSAEIAGRTFKEDTTFVAHYKLVKNVIDAKSKDKIPDDYVPYVFTPGFGRIWDDGSYNPKVVYFNPKSKTYTTDINKKADSVKGRLVGFDGWSTYDANGNIIEDVDSELNKNGVKKTLLFVAKQAHIKDVNVSDIVLGVGDTIPSSEKLVHSDDSTDKPQIVGTSGNGGGYYGDRGVLYNPGITTVTVRVMQPTGRKDKKGKVITEPKDIPIHISVLPNVIAERDLPATDTKEFKYIAQNYTKVTYVVGNGGAVKSPVFTYWVRKGAKNVHVPVPDVLANDGYVFKNWSNVTKNYSLDLTNKGAATSEQKEFLAKRADLAGLSFIAKQIRASKNSSFAALKNLLDLGGKENGITFNLDETIITANFEEMKPMRFEFRSSAVAGIPATFTLANLTENSSGNTTVKVDNTNFTINNFIPDGSGSNGLLSSCTGTTCKISGTPKIVDGKPKVELTFTTVDQYGRRAEIVVYIDVVDSAKPVPVPTPTPEPDYSTVPSDYVVPAPEPAPAPAPAPAEPLPDKQKAGVKGDLLPQTGVDASQSALIASLLASVGLAGFAAKHRRRKNEDNES
ncbi:InlB B-repeat-containing protein [Gardnerella sp. DNF00571G]|uniref:InlB B-repeat-containing protein n=1 Tax=Gardnerella sp. DNF00571G TaxID=2749052 RepID=UPI003BAEE5DF